MKKKIGIIITLTMAILITLSSCNVVGSIINPIIGTWKTTIVAVDVTEVYNANGTFTDTNSLGSLGVTSVGTWTSNSTTLFKTWTDSGDTISYTFTFNSDKSTMTLDTGIISTTYNRQ